MTRAIILLQLVVLTIVTSCNNDDETTPVPSTPSMTATETALLGTWILDKTETYDYNGSLIQIRFTNGTTETYSGGTLISTNIGAPSYNHYTFLSDVYTNTSANIIAADGYRKLNWDANGNLLEHMWKLLPNYSGTGHDKIEGISSCVYIYTLTSSQLILRSSTNVSLITTMIEYYHK